MNKEELAAKLDVDKNGKVNFEDVLAYTGGYTQKLTIGMCVIVGAISFFAGAIIF